MSLLSHERTLIGGQPQRAQRSRKPRGTGAIVMPAPVLPAAPFFTTTITYHCNMFTHDQLEQFFEHPAQLQIENDFYSKCVLCKQPLNADEGHFIPLLNGRDTVSKAHNAMLPVSALTQTKYSICLEGLCTLPCMPDDALNGLFGERLNIQLRTISLTL